MARLGEPGLEENWTAIEKYGQRSGKLKTQTAITNANAYTENQKYWCASIATVLIGLSSISIGGRLFHQIFWYFQNGNVKYDTFKEIEIFEQTISLEFVDQILWASTLLLTVLFFTPTINKLILSLSAGLSEGLSLIAFAIMAISINVVPSDGRYKGILWDGYGIQIFLLTMLLIPIFVFLQTSPREFLGSSLFALAIPLLLYNYAPTIVQPLWAIKELYHSSFVMNEVLSQSRGITPSSDMAAQYTALMGLPLIIVAKAFRIVEAVHLQHSAAVYLSVLAVLTFLLISKIVNRIVPEKLAKFSAAIVIIYVCVTPNGSLTGGITAAWSAIPVRALPVVLIGLLLLSKNLMSKLHALILGFSVALASINNFEFGTPTFIATFIVFFILCRQIPNGLRRYFPMFIYSFVATWICYVVVLGLTSSGFKASYYLLFVLAFGRGFLATPMSTFGPHIFVLSVLAAGVVLGGRLLITPTGEPKDKGDASLVGRAATASLFFGLIGLMTFPYFVNRSTTPSLGIFQVFVAIIVVASFTLLEIDKLQMNSRRSILMLLLMVTPQALLLGSIIQMPNGYDEWRRVADLQSTTYGDRLAEVQQAVSFSEETLNRGIDYFSIGQGNLYLGNNEMRNISLIDDPSELNDPLMLGSSMLARFCEHLDIYTNVEKQFVLVENFYEIKSGLPLCKNYRTILSISEKFSVVVRARQ